MIFKNLIKKLISFIRWEYIIGLYHLLGGVLGFITIYYIISSSIYQIQELEGITVIYFILLILVMILINSLVFITGLFLLKKNKHKGIKLGLVSQAIQIPVFNIPFMEYIFIAGGKMIAYISYTTNSMKIGGDFSTFIYGETFISIPSQAPYYVGVNIIAIVIFIYLLKKSKQLLQAI